MNPEKKKVAVLGGGSWGTALVKVLQHHDLLVGWWVRREAQKEHILREHHNPDYLSYTEIAPDKLFISIHMEEVVRNADIILLAIPSAFLDPVFSDTDKILFNSKVVISAVKGIEPISLLPVYQWLQHKFNVLPDDVGVIGGPCHSEEVAMQRLSYLTLGVFNTRIGEQVGQLLQTPYLKVNLSKDVEGISMASVLKNVYGILCGIASGLRFGDNFQAVMVSNAIHEMEQVLLDISGNSRKINTSVYAGDLIVTAYSRFSRNWMLGNLIGKGYSVKSALLELKMIAEGYYAAASLSSMQGFHPEQYPLFGAVVDILHHNVAPDRAIAQITHHLR